MKKNRYVVLDFETLDTWRASVCSVGCVVIEKGEITDEFYSLVRPPLMFENKYCVDVHGIHYRDVKNSPSFPEVWEKVDRMIDGCPIVAHNAGFEKSCINACAEEFGTNNEYTYIDTLRLSREILTECKNHKLDTICDKLDVELKQHHNALEDARATAECFIKLMKLSE